MNHDTLLMHCAISARARAHLAAAEAREHEDKAQWHKEQAAALRERYWTELAAASRLIGASETADSYEREAQR